MDQCDENSVKTLFPSLWSRFLCVKEVNIEAEPLLWKSVNYFNKLQGEVNCNSKVSACIAFQISYFLMKSKALCWWAPEPLCVSVVLTCPAYNPGRLFRRGIFSKPSPSTKASTSSQPCATSWQSAAALNWGLWKWKAPCCWDTEQEKERSVLSGYWAPE